MNTDQQLIANAFEVLHPGMLTLIQDLGRYGQASLGLTTSGPVDRRAFQWANRLLDNLDNAVALEVTFGGLKLRSHIETLICVTGAKIALKINGKETKTWSTCRVKSGDVIELGYAEQGTRAYLAVAGGFQIAQQFSSCATTVREGIGGVDGKGISAGDVLPAYVSKHPSQRCYLCEELQPKYSSKVLVRLISGYQEKDFSNVEKRRFFSSTYTVSKQWDRMGYRLEGPSIKTEQAPMLSEGITLGAVQIPPDGQPIVLMQDRQTIGGYPKIGSVFSLDLAKLGQCAQGAQVEFQSMTIEHAHNELHLDKFRYENTKVQFSPWTVP